MKIILFSRSGLAHVAADLQRLLKLIDHYGFDYAINQEFAQVVEQVLGRRVETERIYGATTGEQPFDSVMVCCGGDGTLLEGIHRLSNKQIPVAAINFGHLGFLTYATRDSVEELFGQIANHNLNIQPRTMLSVKGAGECELMALNEVAVRRMDATMIKVEAIVNNQRVAQYNGDGVIVSTPTGSTAYSLSAGGPIVAPECGCFLLTPLAPHNFGMRPVVVPDTAEIVLTVKSRQGEAMLSIDNRAYTLGDGEQIRLCRAEEQILLALPHNISFYETLHDKMMWDVDIRN